MAAPVSPAAGHLVTEPDWDTEVYDRWVALGAGWTSWTPVWSCSVTPPSIGNGTLTGAYKALGKTVEFRLRFVAGSTTTYGEGLWGFTLPSGYGPAVSQAAYGMAASAASARYVLGVYLTAANGIFRMVYGGTSGVRTNAGAGNDVPFEWSQNAQLLLGGVYEAS
ncbi:hypothetical protein [Streptosporangium sp. NPDC048865]|uniref:hypothetical protein n=1 Tax=Streptosporangium sp. NPDC048865 TaxID=3155766 RepID=UPI0034270681